MAFYDMGTGNDLRELWDSYLSEPVSAQSLHKLILKKKVRDGNVENFLVKGIFLKLLLGNHARHSSLSSLTNLLRLHDVYCTFSRKCSSSNLERWKLGSQGRLRPFKGRTYAILRVIRIFMPYPKRQIRHDIFLMH